ncbi:MAG: metallophosphoesterase family protein [Clostridia bacterium]|jgi:calcineurin-like phosphoesterase family protein|nr:metallophosphoesterase family protein [Clostridia bacterium]
MAKFYISDLHLGHEKILALDKRPVATVEENEQLIMTKWNAAVTNADIVYILGDASYYDYYKTINIFNKLKGRKIFLRGNHDKWMDEQENKHNSMRYHECLRVGDYLFNEPVTVSLCHYPMAVWDKQFNGGYHLYGHIHLNHHPIVLHPDMNRSFNVGCMTKLMDYTPRTLQDIVIRSQEFQSQNR